MRRQTIRRSNKYLLYQEWFETTIRIKCQQVRQTETILVSHGLISNDFRALTPIEESCLDCRIDFAAIVERCAHTAILQ